MKSFPCKALESVTSLKTIGNKIITFNSKHSEFILHYITLTDYYILNNTFR